MEKAGALSAPQRGTYLQYKRNTSILIRWVVTTAATCTPCALPKPKNNTAKNKKKAARATRAAENNALSPEITVAKLVSLSTAIAEAGIVVPEYILALFTSVIQARTAAYECFEEIWNECQDEDIGESNERHLAFIIALQKAFDALGGEAYAKKSLNGQRSRGHGTTEIAKMEESEAIKFLNRFEGLEVEDVPSEDEGEDEVEVDEMAKPQVPLGLEEPTAPKAKGKGKRKKQPSAQPLENYKFTSDMEIYYAACFFVRDFLELRRYTRDIWRRVGLEQLNVAVAGALSNLAVGIVKSLQFEIATDYPGCVHFRGIVNRLVRNGSPEIIGSVPTSNGSAKSKQLIHSGNRDGMREVSEALLLDTHDDLASFITEYRRTRNGKVSPAFKKVAWNPNFTATTLQMSDMTYQRIRQWKADYAISFLYDLVNTFAFRKLVDKDFRNPEKSDWSSDDPIKSEWINRDLWGANEFGSEITKLAMQKPGGSPVIEELRPHHVFQLQLALDSMALANRWHARDNKTVPPRELYGATSPTLAWDLTASYLHDLRRMRDRWIKSTEAMLSQFKEDAERMQDPGLWSHPILYLDVVQSNAQTLGDTPLQMPVPRFVTGGKATPKSLFSNSNPNGLWLYSPYLCGIGQVEFLNMSYDWGSKCWDRSELIVTFFHIYNALLENHHMSKPIKIFDQIMAIFESDIFRTSRPKLGGRAWAFTDANSISLGVKAQFLRAAPTNRRKTRAGDVGSIFHDKGKPSHHSKFFNHSKLFELSKANWMSARIDNSKFPSLAKPPRRHTEFLDAVLKDLNDDFNSETPIPALNYHAVLGVIMLIYQALDESIRGLESVKKIMAEQEGAVGWQDKMTVLALHTELALLQDSRGERLDTEILRAMGKSLESLWDEMGEEIEQIFVLNSPSDDDEGIAGADKVRLMGQNKNSMAALREKLEGIRLVDPVAYERAIRMAENMPVGGCDTCPDCQAGVPIDALPDTSPCRVQ